MKPIRNSIKAIIIRDSKILCTKNRDPTGVFYLLPGGGEKVGESMKEALKRECLEEIGVEVSIGDIVCVREYIGNNHEFKEQESDVHQIEYMFDCSLNKSELKNSGNFLDKWQIGVEWIDLDNFHNYRFYPKFFQNLIDKKGKYCGNVYLGDVN